MAESLMVLGGLFLHSVLVHQLYTNISKRYMQEPGHPQLVSQAVFQVVLLGVVGELVEREPRFPVESNQ